jgi:hypothetical protein
MTAASGALGCRLPARGALSVGLAGVFLAAAFLATFLIAALTWCAPAAPVFAAGGGLARRVLGAGLAFARLELEDHLAFLGAPGQARLEGAARAHADELVEQVGLAVLQQLASSARAPRAAAG